VFLLEVGNETLVLVANRGEQTDQADFGLDSPALLRLLLLRGRWLLGAWGLLSQSRSGKRQGNQARGAVRHKSVEGTHVYFLSRQRHGAAGRGRRPETVYTVPQEQVRGGIGCTARAVSEPIPRQGRGS